MAKRNIVAGIDIGSFKVCTIIGEIKKNSGINIIGIGTSPSTGVKKGAVVDIDSTVKAISNSVKKAEKMANVKIDSVFVNFSGGNVALIKNRGIVAVSREDKEVTMEDVERAIQTAKVVAIPSDREIIDVIPVEFIIDGNSGIKDPVGMVGVRLETVVNIVTGSTTIVHNLMRCVRKSGLEIEGMILGCLASAEVVLNDDEKELGVVMIDVGGGITNVSVFEEGNLCYISSIPVGGDYITNDIAVGLRIPLSKAEELKRNYGRLILSESDKSKDIEIKRIGEKIPSKITCYELNKIIEARVYEIIELVKQDLEKSGFISILPAGAVITGGGVYSFEGMTELASSLLDMPVRIAVPEYLGVNDPSYTVAIGLLEYAYKSKFFVKQAAAKTDRIDSFINKLKNWLKDYF